jgi:hypothetical protein
LPSGLWVILTVDPAGIPSHGIWATAPSANEVYVTVAPDVEPQALAVLRQDIGHAIADSLDADRGQAE